MTIREWAEDYCFQRGMFPAQAKAVIDQYAASNEGKPIEGRWHDATEGYPPQLRALLAMGIDRAAVEWIDANLPKAWFRPMFVPNGIPEGSEP